MSVFSRFFENRAPRSNEIRLSLKNIYVFFSPHGMLFLALLLITFVAGVNYGNNLILGLFFYLLSIWLVSTIIAFLQLSALSIRLEGSALAEAGSLIWVSIKLKNHQGKAKRQIRLSFYHFDERIAEKLKNKPTAKRTALYQAFFKLSAAEQQQFLAHHEQTVAVIDQEVIVPVPVISEKRGAVIFPKLTLKTSYPLGVMQSWSYAFFVDTGFAYPCPLAFESSEQTSYAAVDDAASAQHKSGQDDFDRLDSYQAGESLTRVSWRHVASGMGMLTKQFSDPVGQTLTIDYHAMPAFAHEDKLGQLSHCLLELKGSAAPFRFVLPNGEVWGAGDDFIEHCLLLLAQSP